MSFFDKKQEVIDIRLTQFGKNLLARGFFKPVYYRFFDDDIIYNSNCAGFKEEQNRTEERILEAQRLKTQHLTLSVEEKFDQNQELINSGSVKTFMQISRRQDPLFTEAILKYPLENSKMNSNVAPSFNPAWPKTNAITGDKVVSVSTFNDSLILGVMYSKSPPAEKPIEYSNCVSAVSVMKNSTCAYCWAPNWIPVFAEIDE